ncbi:ABC-F family ATP-binding cassette domain-containing protein [Vibrio ostreicida]|uniref:ABC-F family ATP-binding cassette domain-containing protein n=1 Tax=Vibrio ostreicida TaxID=526588 RepID=UPI0009708D95|nr:ABC-F family ATP-binding cassette domain-containing protein [Vibrio ostreicida]
MTTYLTAQSISLSYTGSELFDCLNFSIHRGDKIGLIGYNGCGKSSLLKLLDGQIEANQGQVASAKHCLVRYVEQHIPPSLAGLSVLDALAQSLGEHHQWQAQSLLDELGFVSHDWNMPVEHCSGGQQMKLLLARAIIHQPDLLLLDEPSNHLDLPSLLWLERFLSNWSGSFVLVSHDETLLDSATNTTWILRDQSLHHYALPCSQARKALAEKDEQDKQRCSSEQKEIIRIEKSAKRLAQWGKVYDNEGFARKAKSMMVRKDRLIEQQTSVSGGTPWSLQLTGEALPANRLLEIASMNIAPREHESSLFEMGEMRIKSGDKIAVIGSNGCGKSTLLNRIHQAYLSQETELHPAMTFHPRVKIGYYDQSLAQLNDGDTLSDALLRFSALSSEECKRALISAGFEYARHSQTVASLSGGERARLLFIGLSLARYHLLFLDEPTNHLDMEGKQALIEALNHFVGAVVLVSHDRRLIEQSCHRFWLINEGQLTELLSVEETYQRFSSDPQVCFQANQNSTRAVGNTVAFRPVDDEECLERLIELETLLEEDKKRKLKHQKLNLQAVWKEEIDQITQQLFCL